MYNKGYEDCTKAFNRRKRVAPIALSNIEDKKSNLKTIDVTQFQVVSEATVDQGNSVTKFFYLKKLISYTLYHSISNRMSVSE